MFKLWLWFVVLTFGVGPINAMGAVELNGDDLGSVTRPGSIQTNSSGGIILTGSGAGIGLRRDDGYFAWTRQEGDFDVAVRIESLTTPDLFGRAGLMARASLEADSLFAGVFATTSVAGTLFQARLAAASNGRQGGVHPAQYPAAWVRLQREGNLFTGAASSDGVHWTRLDSATLNLTEPVYLGLAITSWSTNASATAVFRDWNSTTDPIDPASTPALELPGPSTRRTGLVISEIMYHPKDRTDGRNGEFIELFNSESVFNDISGYRLAGAVEFTFPEGTVLPAGGFVVVARVPEDVRQVYGIAQVLGGYSRDLDNSSGTVQLLNPIGALMLQVEYGSRSPWPVSADGAGHSLVLARPSFGEGSAQAWLASARLNGSPGRWDSRIESPLNRICINEVRPRSTGRDRDYVELYNHGNRPVDLSNAWLSDNPAVGRFRLPPGTVIPAGGFLSFDEEQLGFGFSSSGESVYLTAPGEMWVIDAVRFDPQTAGAAYGRVPNGAATFRTLEAPTPGGPNGRAIHSDVVINEIMYHPVSNEDDDQFVELFNSGITSVDLTGWAFTSGIRYTFEAGAILPPGGYLVVARNAERLRTQNPELTSANCVGNFEGSLSGRGERLVLSRPERLSGLPSEIIYVAVTEVIYKDGGRWGRWSDGDGSSLELIDSRADPALAANWADSDETAKGEWTTVEHTGVLDLGMGQYGINQVQILMEGIGECLVDDVEVIGPGGTNMIANGTFEGGLAGWFPQGSHRESTLEEGTGINGSQCLHVRARSRGDPGANRIRATVAAGLREGQTVTLRAKVRWLRGFPGVLIRLRGNYLEAEGHLHTSGRLGTPGRRNSRAVVNAPPAIYDVVHSPILPSVDQPVVVTARVDDPDGVRTLLLRYRLDPAQELADLPMRDDGTAGDEVAGDGIYSATVPGQSMNALVAFHLSATDAHSTPATGTFPDDAPQRECLVRFGEAQPGGTLGTYRIWMTQAVRNQWSTREKLNNGPLDVTFVYGNQRVIYNAGSLYTGSPFVSPGYTGPTGALCGYAVHFPSDDRFLGADEIKLDWPVRDGSLQMEQVAYWIAEELRIPSNHRRFVHLYVNGARRGTIYEDSQQPNSDMVEQYFPDDTDGDLYKIDDWFEFDNGAANFVNTDATLQLFTSADDEKKVARYRWNWRKRAVQSSAGDYRTLFGLVDATLATTLDEFTRRIESQMDVEKFLGVVALEHIVGNWDSFGYGRGKNMFTYKPERGKWVLFMWDIDFVLGAQSDPPDAYLYGTIDPTISQMLFTPAFQRVYYRLLQEAADGPLQAERFAPVLDANYAALTANGLSASSPRSGSNYITRRMRHIQQELTQWNSPFALSSPSNSISTASNIILLEGTAPIQVREIRVNGVPYPVTWIDPTHWQLRIPVTEVSSRLLITATGIRGQAVGQVQTLQVTYTGPAVAPEHALVFNEIMFRPSVVGGEFVELHNTHDTFAFDLSRWLISGLDFTLPEGTILEPGGYLVVGRDQRGFWEAYGPDILPVGFYPGNLDPEGEVLRLLRPGTPMAEPLVVSELPFGNQRPWPELANTGGVSLQLRDPRHDQSRPGNWAARVPEPPQEWVRVTTTGRANSSRLLVYLSGLPPVRDLSSIEGAWVGEVDFGEATAQFNVEFRSTGEDRWEGDFIYQLGNREERVALGSVGVTNRVLTFGFVAGAPEFRFTLPDQPMSLTGRYQPPGQPSLNATLQRFNPGGEVYLDDLSLVKGSAPGAGGNLLRNGDFESPLSDGWTVAQPAGQSKVSTEAKHGGDSSLHFTSSSGGYNESQAVWQDVTGLEPGEVYTLSYWVRRGTDGTAIVVRLGDWSLSATHELRPIQQDSVAYTPGRVNSTREDLPEWPPIWLNEFYPGVAAAGSSNLSGAWVELWNSGTNVVPLGEFILGDSYVGGSRWAFPTNGVLSPGQYRLVWLDGAAVPASGGEWHATFRPDPVAGSLVLWRATVEGDQLIDYLDYANVPNGFSVGWLSEGAQSERWVFTQPTPSAANDGSESIGVVINEWMADNVNSWADPMDGDFEDWLELYNPATTAADLSGYLLSDSVASPGKFVIPPGTRIPPRGYLLVWADEEPEQNQPGSALHAGFRLGAGGEVIVLTAPDGRRVDLVSFGPQIQNVSEGRFPDGDPVSVRVLERPSPGASNAVQQELRLSGLSFTEQGGLRARWSSAAGQQFRIQFKNSLNDSTWIDLGPAIVATGDETQANLEIPPGGQRFFRLVFAPP